MPSLDIIMESPVIRSARVQQLEGLFDLPVAKSSQFQLTADFDLDSFDWQIGLVVGPSGSGKTSLITHCFGDKSIKQFQWDPDHSVIDSFAKEMGIKAIVELLSSVGFSSPPAWLRPFQRLSNGEQFRVHVARALAESGDLTVIDEFTSVVDRTVAQMASAAISRTVRRKKTRFIASSCHYDIIDWLDPDWIYEPHLKTFRRRSLQGRPAIELVVRKADKDAWQLFRHHHYLDHNLHPGAKCFVGLVNGLPAGFTAVLSFPHAHRPGWREHRTVCLPDFQGVGIGNGMSEFIAGLFKSTGKPYRSRTSHPAMIAHRSRSPFWKTIMAPNFCDPPSPNSKISDWHRKPQTRWAATFEYTGPSKREEARAFGLA